MEASMHQGILASPLFRLGLVSFLAFFSGRYIKKLSLPSLLGFMITGAIMGPSLFNIFDIDFQKSMEFITEISLSFVAVSIGLELNLVTLKKQGVGILVVIFSESFMAFVFVTTGIYLFTKNLPLALVFGAIAPASAPAGTVAVIQECRASGSLTKALYTVVGFDDGLGIIIFGFASAVAKILLGNQIGIHNHTFLEGMKVPLVELSLSILTGFLAGVLFSFLSRKIRNQIEIFMLLFTFILMITGICMQLHLSFILTNMILGIFIVNTQPKKLIVMVEDELKRTMPLLFLLFFVLAGAHLDVANLLALGGISMVYFFLRVFGLILGGSLGAKLGGLEKKIQKYIGLGILSQAGVAIGLSLLVAEEFMEYGEAGIYIGNTVLTTITATSILFAVIGPVLTKIALTKAKEIKV
ncbi:MAG: hypothetical protein C0601_11800 [Candidatus Muiribacterium halophilum]|uniref:Cation/H+ exchanger transmembrane domain-containing protein n=1 Tax=Muiribacterium halophilum TaxID=2053465 RepID=A0A2N5ZBA1_MUIH1|nr:MAG: hypothetical protein C0601_11800 [Candidatus Muirbacterium halophilum]